MKTKTLLAAATLALSGFFLQNTVFTWPKLSAAAFAAGEKSVATSTRIMPRLSRPARRSRRAATGPAMPRST